MLSEKYVLAIYRRFDAVWFYDYSRGDSSQPHAELTSGFCSDGYVNSAPVMSDPATAEFLAGELAYALRHGRHIREVNWVVGSAYAAITFSYELARRFGARHGFVEKDPQNPKRMVWTGRVVIPGGSLVLQCEELVTTLGTTMEARRAIQEGNPEFVRFLPDVATAIYRPPKLQGGIIDVTALVRREVRSWKPEECPLCAQGSPRLRPKEHWRELTGR